MKITIHQGEDGKAIVVVQSSDSTDSPKKVVEAYLEVQNTLKREGK